MTLTLAPYLEQRQRWPASGRHIMAQFDDHSIVVYQAYRPEIGRFAAQHQRFGGAFKLDRMSWIKPNFLWMMYRCGWARKPGQEVVLAVRLKRAAFDEILAGAVFSSFPRHLDQSPEGWKADLQSSEVRLQWDPDHGLRGEKLDRRALQLGLRGSVLARYAEEWILSIEDISAFVAEQRAFVEDRRDAEVVTPAEAVYPVSDPELARRLNLDAPPTH